MPKNLPWEQLQVDTQTALKTIDPGVVKISRGSGSVKGNGDVQSEHFMAECKLRSTNGFTIDYNVFLKIVEEAELLGKIPLLVNRNVDNETLVTMKLNDLIIIFQNK